MGQREEIEMQGLMQDWPLRVHTVLDHAQQHHPEAEVITRTVEGPIVSTSYAQLHSRARKAAKALQALGIGEGDVVATMAWNGARHMEAWYGIMGLGAVCHTLNPRLFEDQLVYIANHAQDSYLMLDTTFTAIAEKMRPRCPDIKGYIFLTDRAHMPETSLPNVLCYEELLDAQDDDFAWAAVDENTACGLCYTSGTTGNPKGVVYTHRSNVLHAMAANTPDGFALGSRDSVLPVVPMFHANAWALVFVAPMVGAKLVMPGPKMDGQSICELLTDQHVTFSAAVPTVWLGLLEHLDSTGTKLPDLSRVMIGGAACPRVVIEAFAERYDVDVMHGWGMTEMSPLGTFATFKAGMHELDAESQMKYKLKQGRVPYTVEMKILDDEGKELPRDGETFGNLVVRGPAISSAYHRDEGGEILDAEGFFDTGDVATIDERGFMQITDRSKDVIKSGGEWISSIELENAAVGHPDIAEAAVIGVAHPKWTERPLLILVAKAEARPDANAMRAFLSGKVAKWWMPDDVVYVDEIPHTATGKIQKRTLREQFADYKLPNTDASK